MSNGQKRCLHSESGASALERDEETALGHQSLAISPRCCETRRGDEVPLHMEIVAESRQQWRNQNSGDDRTTGNSRECTENKRGATDASPAPARRITKDPLSSGGCDGSHGCLNVNSPAPPECFFNGHRSPATDNR
jgi:hypothetical protein